jgi:hypothetical protein
MKGTSVSNTPAKPGQTPPQSTADLLRAIDVETALLVDDVRKLKSNPLYCSLALLDVLELQGQVVS